MADIRIKVGAALDRSTLSAFESIVGAAKRARAGISQSERQGQQEAKTIAREQERTARSAARAAEREARSAAHAKAQAEREAGREIEREAKRLARERENIERNAHRAAVREAKQAADEQKRIARSLNDEQNRIAKGRADFRDRAGAAAGRLAYRGVRAAGRAAVGMVGDLARGAGVNFSLGSLAEKNVDLETKATQLSNQAYQEGPGAQGKRQDPTEITRKVREVANATAIDAGDAMEALQAFVGKTGDLQTGQASLLELSKLSKATGTNLADMADAAGDVSNNLGDIPNKGEVISQVMRQIAAQGKVGAVEIKDLANQMAKVASAANQFEGDPSKSIATFGALAQYSRQKGGSASATQAATSTMSFMGTFSKGARLAAFDKYGVSTEGAGRKVRDPIEIILAALNATKGSNIDRKMGEMFMDTRARAVTRPFEGTFKAAYEKAQGTEQQRLEEATKAVREEFNKLRDATMSNKELEDSFAAAMATSGSQAQLFNNQLQELTAELQSQLYPALKDLAPLFISAATSLADFITQITGKDPRKQAEAQRADALNFGSASTTEKALKTGQISQADLDQNKEAEKKLEEIQKQKQANVAKVTAQQNSGLNLAVSGALKAFGTTEGQQEFDRSRQQRIETAQGEAADAAKHLKDLKEQNKKLSDAVQGGALKVIIVSGDVKPKAPPQETQ